jgi:heme-degrading monooxygenase HmoA
MVTIVTEIEVKQGRAEEWDAAMQERMSAVRHQPGWVGGQMLRPEGDPVKRLIVGTWQTRDDWKRWHDDPQVATTREELNGLTEGAEQHEWYGVVLDVRPAQQTRGAASKRSAPRSGGPGKHS